MKKIILNCNDCFSAYTFRLGLIKELQKEFEVKVLAGFDKYLPLLAEEGIQTITFPSRTASCGLRDNFRQLRFYRKVFKYERPDLIINYSIKPHLHGTLAAPRKCKVINVVTGLGTAFEEENWLFKTVKCLYRLIARKVDHYIFLNEDDYHGFAEMELLRQPHTIIPGEGVELEKFQPYVNLSVPPVFIFIGRLVREKGIKEYLEAAKIIKRRFPDVSFWIAGDFYKKKSAIKESEIRDYEDKGIVKYLGHRFDIPLLLKDVHVVVLPSYREGMPFSLMEGLTSKKFLIASDVPGCRDVVKDGYNGFLVKPGSSYDLMLKMEKYIKSEYKEDLHENAYASAGKFDQKKIIPEIVGLIREMI